MLGFCLCNSLGKEGAVVRCVFGTERSCGRVEWTEAGGNARGPLRWLRLQPPGKRPWPRPHTPWRKTREWKQAKSRGLLMVWSGLREKVV